MTAETVYQTLFWIGSLGVVAMGAMGALHGSGYNHGHGHGHAADGSHAAHGPLGHHEYGVPSASAHHPVAHHGAHHHGAHSHDAFPSSHHQHHEVTPREGAGNSAGAMITILGYLSPMTLFSVSLGAGATGLLLGDKFAGVLTAILAMLAGMLFFGFLIRPAMRFIQGFASQPAKNLAGVVATEAVAQNRFDERGRGIVRLPIDGEIVRLLAYLEPEDHAKGIEVAPGDKLTVTRIDEGTNTCHVTKL